MNQINPIKTKATYTDVRLWTALVTPMLPNGDIDFVNLVQLAKRQAEAGNGITLLGSTAEGLALTSEEQFAIVNCICELSLNVPLMVAVGGYNLSSQLSWLKQCNSLAIDAYLLTSPIYAKPGEVGLTAWFTTLLEQAQHPCMIYNVPSRSGINIPVSVMQNISTHRNCWAMKEASGDLNTFLAYREHCTELAIYSGEDDMMPYLMGAGVKGLVSVAANVWPEATHQYVKMALAGKHQTLFPVWKQAVSALFQVSSPIPVKTLMHRNQLLNFSTLRAPLTALEITESPLGLEKLVSADQSINQWFKQNQPSDFVENNQIIGVK